MKNAAEAAVEHVEEGGAEGSDDACVGWVSGEAAWARKAHGVAAYRVTGQDRGPLSMQA